MDHNNHPIGTPNKLLGLPPRRKAAGFTQEALAAALGVPRVTLTMWETGRSWPPAAILPAIADLLLCSIDDLYQLQDSEPADSEIPPNAPIVKLYGGGVVDDPITDEED